MKRLLLLISLICAVPMVAGMSSQANAGNQKNQKELAASAAKSASKGFLTSGANSRKKVALKQGTPTDPAPTASPTTDPAPTASPTDPAPAPVAPDGGANSTTSPAPVASPEAPPPNPTSSEPSSVTPTAGGSNSSLQESQNLRMRLDGVSKQEFDIKCPCYGQLSPGMTLFNPAGFGADKNTLFLTGSYQSSIRQFGGSDGELGVGLGVGDARDWLGLEVAYTMFSFGRSQGFGSGAFSAKVHKRLDDDLSVAVGWNRFADVKFGGGAGIDFDYPKNSYYGAITKVFATTDNVDSFLSRIALTAGVGGGVFLPEQTLRDAAAAGTDPSGVNVFGSAAFRIAQPVSAIVEWTGQDLAAGLSIVPFQGFPLVISPGFRDIAGAGNGARFVVGAGLTYQF
jgi:hypothetical protein